MLEVGYTFSYSKYYFLMEFIEFATLFFNFFLKSFQILISFRQWFITRLCSFFTSIEKLDTSLTNLIIIELCEEDLSKREKYGVENPDEKFYNQYFHIL